MAKFENGYCGVRDGDMVILFNFSSVAGVFNKIRFTRNVRFGMPIYSPE